MAKEITKEFQLKPEEAVVYSAQKVGYGDNPFNKNNDLILTNQALIFIKKDLFGKTKEVVRYPLSDICISNGKPQVIKSMINSVNASFDVYLTYGVEKFKFDFSSDVEEWVASTIETITGQKVERKTGFEDFAGFDDLVQMADSVANSVNGLKKAFGIKSDEMVACKCSSCGASVSGIIDEVIECPYCGTHVKIVYKS